MNFFSRFCNICYKYDDKNLKDICKGDTELIKCTLISLIGHADILNCNPIFLCQKCCQKLINVDTFKNNCFNNLIQLRKDYLHMKSELELKTDTRAVQQVLNNFLDDQVFHKKYLGKSNIVEIESSDDSNQDFDVSIIESNERNISEGIKLHKNFDAQFPVEELDISNENITLEGSELRVTESQSNENVNFGFKISNVYTVKEDCKDKDTSNKERTIAERKLGIRKHKNKDECNTSEGEFRTSKLYKNSKAEFATEELDVNNEIENTTAENSELKEMTNESNENVNYEFEISNVCSVTNTGECDDMDTSNKPNTKGGMKLRNRKSCDYRIQSDDDDESVSKGTKKKGKYSHMCHYCKRTFQSVARLNVHKRVHSRPLQVYRCNVCSKSFARMLLLDNHKIVHSDARPYTCSVCKKSFKRYQTLARHQRLHTGERPYVCTVCNKSFTRVDNLRKHKRVHDDEIWTEKYIAALQLSGCRLDAT